MPAEHGPLEFDDVVDELVAVGVGDAGDSVHPVVERRAGLVELPDDKIADAATPLERDSGHPTDSAILSSPAAR